MKLKRILLLVGFLWFTATAPAASWTKDPLACAKDVADFVAKGPWYWVGRGIGGLAAKMMLCRYEPIVSGYEEILAAGKEGILLNHNHQTWGADPFLQTIVTHDDLTPRPVILENEYRQQRLCVDVVDPVVVPVNPRYLGLKRRWFESESNFRKRRHRAVEEYGRKTEKCFKETAVSLKEGRNISLYAEAEVSEFPISAIKKGKKGLYQIVQACKELGIRPRIVVARADLAGSSFAHRGINRHPSMFKLALWAGKIFIVNRITKIPRRKVPMRFKEVTDRFPWDGTADEMNAVINEEFATNPVPPPPQQVPYYYWEPQPEQLLEGGL
jgi:hypothetical protein